MEERKRKRLTARRKFEIYKEMGSRYMFTLGYLFLEKLLRQKDYLERRARTSVERVLLRH